MAVIEIIQFSADLTLEMEARHAIVDDTIEKATEALQGSKPSQRFVLGTQVQDKGAIHVMSEQENVPGNKNFENTSDLATFVKCVSSSMGEPHTNFHVALGRPAFGSDGPATASVIEFVEIFFPVSRITPEFQKKIEEDFIIFDDIFITAAKGTASWTAGWVLEAREHEDLKGEKAKCFFVVRAWESMEHFEKSLKTDAYKKAVPILLGWNAPFKMWHIERKISNCLEDVI